MINDIPYTMTIIVIKKPHISGVFTIQPQRSHEYPRVTRKFKLIKYTCVKMNISNENVKHPIKVAI